MKIGVLCPALALILALLTTPWSSMTVRSSPLTLGANFSCRQAEWLELDCRTAYVALLQELGVKHFRLSVYWDQIEPSPGEYDLRLLRWQLDQAAQHNASVVLTIGIKGQRWPEVYVPAWLWNQVSPPPGVDLGTIPALRSAALSMLTRVVTELAEHPAIEAWQVENEPSVRSGRFQGRFVGPAMLQDEIEAVRQADPYKRPIIVTYPWTSIHDRNWLPALTAGDILGLSYHTKRPELPWRWFYLQPFHLGPFSPDIPAVVRIAAGEGKRVWIMELQAEAWERTPLKDLAPADNHTMSTARLDENVRRAQAIGVARAYLWGVEWWLYQREHRQDSQFWDAGRRLFQGQSEIVSPTSLAEHHKVEAR